MQPWYSSAIKPDAGQAQAARPALTTGRAGKWLAYLYLLCAMAATLAPGATAQTSSIFPGQARFLEVDEAFSFYSSLDSAQQISIHWNIAAGYYLYDDKFQFQLRAADGTELSVGAEIPEGLAHHDEFFGDVEVHYGELRTVVTLPAGYQQPFDLIIGFQGCAEAGLCYPPQRRTLEIFP